MISLTLLPQIIEKRVARVTCGACKTYVDKSHFGLGMGKGHINFPQKAIELIEFCAKTNNKEVSCGTCKCHCLLLIRYSIDILGNFVKASCQKWQAQSGITRSRNYLKRIYKKTKKLLKILYFMEEVYASGDKSVITSEIEDDKKLADIICDLNNFIKSFKQKVH